MNLRDKIIQSTEQSLLIKELATKKNKKRERSDSDLKIPMFFFSNKGINFIILNFISSRKGLC